MLESVERTWNPEAVDLSVDEFVRHLRNSKLLSEEQLNSALDGVALHSPAPAFAGSLHQAGLLTQFQVKQLLVGNSRLVIGPYRLLEEIGRGGFGAVYKARHSLMERTVALKVIAPEVAEDARARQWFRREIVAVTRLTHPNIVLAYDAAEADGLLFLSMEFVDGLNLHQLVRKHGPLPLRLGCELLHQAGKALQYAHEQGLVHRDIKPANLLIPTSAVACLQASTPLSPWGRGVGGEGLPAPPVMVKVVDFGLARLQGSATVASMMPSQKRGFLGTPEFVSPEQARDSQDADIRSDLYSLGCTFYFALTGHYPFRGDSPLETIVQHLERTPTPIEQHRPETPPGLGSVLRRLMARDPDKRFQTPAELVSELTFLFGQVVAATGESTNAARADADGNPKPDKQTKKLQKPLPIILEPASSAAPLPDMPAAGDPLPHGRGSDMARTTNLAPVRPGRWTQSALLVASENKKDESAQAVAPAPATNKGGSDAKPALKQCWRQWLGVVQAVVNRRVPKWQGEEYSQLHALLLRELGRARDDADAAQRANIEKLSSLVQPWLSVQTIADADRAALCSLLDLCEGPAALLGLTPLSLRPVLMVALAALSAGGLFGFVAAAASRGTAGGFTPAALWELVNAYPLLAAAGVLPLLLLVALLWSGRSSPN
ncbi:MAG: serine/threonine protein kinase [Gemmataceae bacterium]|nr:serine/threonine protein kinase [Gemmataceae bacterium]